MKFEEKLQMYAELLVTHGMNVQPGQSVNISCEVIHRDFAAKIVKAAYKKGAKFVNVDFIDPEHLRLRIKESQRDEYLQYVPHYVTKKYDDFIDEKSCILRLTGSENPTVLADLSADRVNSVQKAMKQGLRRYFTEGVGKSKVQWTVAAASTPQWAKRVFPELNEDEAYIALWDAIFHITRSDSKDCLKVWKEHSERLRKRSKKLTELQIKDLHFTGPGTDFTVRLSPKSIFKGGGDTTPQGIDFEPNIPTEECFTTPDARHTEGKVRVTRPVLVNGKLVKDLTLEFSKGVITHFSASEGKEQFAAYIENDPGAKRLGEVSLVGIDSPIYQSRRVFEEILLDENAACHIALGLAYRFCLDNGSLMSPEELEACGFNDSLVHTDFMISSEEVNVTCTTYSGKEIQLINKGEWMI